MVRPSPENRLPRTLHMHSLSQSGGGPNRSNHLKPLWRAIGDRIDRFVQGFPIQERTISKPLEKRIGRLATVPGRLFQDGFFFASKGEARERRRRYERAWLWYGVDGLEIQRAKKDGTRVFNCASKSPELRYSNY